MLQVFDDLDALGQLALERRQGLFGQWRTRLGCITLPGQRIRNIELGHGQQRLRLGSPFSGHRILALGAFDLIELLAQRFGGTLVAAAEFFKDFGDLLNARVARQPLAHPRSALARGGRGEGTAGELI